MKRIKINTTFEEDEQERIDFFANLSYSERLRYFFKLRRMINFRQTEKTGKIFKIYHSYEEAQADKLKMITEYTKSFTNN